MDFQFHLKQLRNQQESSETNQQQQQQQLSFSATTTLPLFVPEEAAEVKAQQQQQEQQQKQRQDQEQKEEEEEEASYFSTKFTNNLSSAFPSSRTNSNYTNMGKGYLNWAQFQELELQALIYRYMVAGATVPPELLQPIKKSLFLHSHLPPPLYNPSATLLQSGYWGRAGMDPEPSRCRRTDGKKWRCSKDVVAGHKYCERHVHRGRNRSRKPVEIPNPAASAATGNSQGGIFKTASPIMAAGATALSAVAGGGGGGGEFSLSGSSRSTSTGLFQLNQSASSEVKGEGHVLRPFFDDWPRLRHGSDNSGRTVNSSGNSSNSLSMSDVSLKLSTGNVGDEPSRDQGPDRHPMSMWATGWGSNQVQTMGGPLAEALRSSSAVANSSPTSVLHRGPASEPSFIGH